MALTFDLHDEAYYAWRAGGVRDALLVHVDAHHDAAADPAWKTVDIGNYVRAAIREGFVREVRWVIPDPVWQDAASRAFVIAELEGIGDGPLVSAGDVASTQIEGVPIRVGVWEAVAPRDAEVLLDIDDDYLFTTAYEAQRSAPPLDLPWCWPDALVDRIARHDLCRQVTTIAASTTGGFAPLEWAHLAQEIALRLEGSTSPSLACFDRLRMAAQRRQAGDLPAASDDCRRAVDLLPSEPAAWLHLAGCLAAEGRAAEARQAFARATALDARYLHPFRTRGPYLLRRGRLDEAEAAYQAALAIAPEDPHALTGLSLVALERGAFAEARALARRALDAGPPSIDAWRVIGRASAQLDDPREAIHAFERALLLGLHGAAALHGPWASNPEGRVIDAGHWDDHAALADLYTRVGDAAAAAPHRRIASAGASVLRS